ncbi:MAG TPA: EF-hand domain-containing protein [Dokdonella sp.]|nr:EF-hand domain-containing protein [Dokdonella sp.]
MNLPRITHPLFAAAFMVASLTACAQQANTTAGKQTAPEWTRADSNRDGFLSKDELVPYPALGQDFDKIDADHDGRISEAEYKSWLAAEHTTH